jgi:diguanylate cyclase (GGDEF)-like protein/PAS domain S-box-containing protein
MAKPALRMTKPIRHHEARSPHPLAAGDARFRMIFDAVNEGIFLSDPATGRFTEVNEPGCRMFGYTRAELIGCDIVTLSSGMHPYTQERAMELLQMAAADGPQVFDWQGKRKNGALFWVEISLRYREFGKIPAVAAIVRKIDERKRSAAKLYEAEAARRTAENAVGGSAALRAVIASIAALINNPSLDDGAPKALRMVGEALNVDRCVVVENIDRAGAPPNLVPSYQWNRSGLEPLLPPFVAEMVKHPDVRSWLAPLDENKPVITTLANAGGTVKGILRALKSASILLIPILVAGRNWGHIGLNDGTPNREWTAAEIDSLLALATLFGVTIERGRQIQKLADADLIVRHSPTILYRLSAEPGLPMTYVSSNVTLMGYDQATMLAEPTLYRKLIHPDDRARIGKDLAQTLRGRTPAATLEVRILTAGGSYLWFEVHRTRIVGGNGAVKGIEGELVDITERKRTSDQLSHTARHDFLTGLPNRAAFVEELGRLIARSRRDGKSFAVLYLDLDYFKDINDILGHPVGDLLLRAVAKRLMGAVREVDTVSRFGGDEFAVLNTEIGEPADAVVLADKILKAVGEPFTIQGNEIRTGASIGIAVSQESAADAEMLLSHADVALYRAKAEGRGTYSFFTEAMDTEVRGRVKLTAELGDAIASGQLFLAYQPQVDTETGHIIGLEALARWRHPTRGIIQPGEFIPVAEWSGLIVALGRWVLREACRQMKEWIDLGIAPPLIAVNVSALQFKTPLELENDIAAILAQTGVPPGLLELELTESVFMEVSRNRKEILDRLRKSGLRVAIDDFGTGYSSLEYLGRLPVNRIKIAQNFMPNLTPGSRSATIVRTAIGMAHDLGLDAIVEGVETVEQLETIRTFSARKVQGFYFSKPLPAGEVAALLRAGWIAPASCGAAEIR